MRRRLAEYLDRTWYCDRPPPLALRGLAGLYQIFAVGRLARPSARPPCPVIVVGNLTVGGSGKTPVVAALVESLRATGLKAAIICRGYGGRQSSRPRPVTADADPARDGDEAVMLAQATGVPVWVGRDRKAGLEAAVAEGAQVVVSDDGLQHVALPRSFEICVVDGARRFGNGRLLPAGPLRQPLERLSRVDAVLVKCTGPDDRVRSGELLFWLKAWRLRALTGDAVLAAGALAPGPIDAVAGIGHPEAFFSSLLRLGYSIRRHPRPDHHRFGRREIEHMSGPVVVTAKDAVKLSRLTRREDIWILDVTAGLPSSLVEQVLAHVREFRGS